MDAATAGARSLAHICNIMVLLPVNCQVLCLLSCRSALLSKAAPPLNPLCQLITPIFKTECDDCVGYVGRVFEVQVHLSVLVQCLNERQTILHVQHTHTQFMENIIIFMCNRGTSMFGWCKFFLNWSTQLWCMRFQWFENDCRESSETNTPSGWALSSLQSYPLVCILPCHNM